MLKMILILTWTISKWNKEVKSEINTLSHRPSSSHEVKVILMSNGAFSTSFISKLNYDSKEILNACYNWHHWIFKLLRWNYASLFVIILRWWLELKDTFNFSVIPFISEKEVRLSKWILGSESGGRFNTIKCPLLLVKHRKKKMVKFHLSFANVEYKNENIKIKRQHAVLFFFLYIIKSGQNVRNICVMIIWMKFHILLADSQGLLRRSNVIFEFECFFSLFQNKFSAQLDECFVWVTVHYFAIQLNDVALKSLSN